jgi:hypothetical protein
MDVLRRGSIFLLIAVLYSCTPYGVRKDHNIIGGTQHKWKQVELCYYINREANPQSEMAINMAFSRWQEATGAKLKFEYKGRNRAGLFRDGKNTFSFLVKWPKGIPESKIAYCRKWYDASGAIVESDIIFNMKLAKFTTLSTNTDDSYYIEGICAHEIGHMLGLGHIDNGASIMKEILNIEDSRSVDIDAYTLNSFQNVYGN